VSYDSFDARYPKTQGAFLRDALGKDYVSIGFSFYKGAFIGAGWPDPTKYTTALGRAHDILVHLHDVEATTYLGAP
jgi:erythromycin esterase